jgi:hypothetical protein
VNAFFSTRDNLDPNSNLTKQSDLHSEKHCSPKTSTDAGRIMSIKPVPRNASFSTREILDPDSNLTEESNLHQEKHDSPKTSTDEGRMI